MKWSVVLCARCNEGVLVPGEVAERVSHGESTIWCEACIRDFESIESE